MLSRWEQTITDEFGNRIDQPTVRVQYEISGAPNAVLKADKDGVTPLSNSFTPAPGVDPFFYVAGGFYKITITKGAYTKVLRDVALGTAAGSDSPPFIPAGDWDSETLFERHSLVRHTGGVYFALQPSEDVEPGVDVSWADYWFSLVEDGVDGTVLPAIAPGDAGKALIVNETEDGYEYGTVAGGGGGVASYAVDDLPPATTPGEIVFVSDELGGAVLAFADGTVWRRVTDRAAVAPAFEPTDISGLWWLSTDYGVTGASPVTAWASRGDLTPGFVVKGTGITLDGADMEFPGAAGSFLYEGTPISNVDSFTLFGLIRRDRVSSQETVIGKYVTASGNKRSWQLAFSASVSYHAAAFTSSDGSAATTTDIGGIGSAGDYVYFVIRKNGTDLDAWWNGVADLNNTVPSTLFDITEPICIGGRAGDASTNVTDPWQGAVREMGFYNNALADNQVDLLLAWLSERMP